MDSENALKIPRDMPLHFFLVFGAIIIEKDEKIMSREINHIFPSDRPSLNLEALDLISNRIIGTYLYGLKDEAEGVNVKDVIIKNISFLGVQTLEEFEERKDEPTQEQV